MLGSPDALAAISSAASLCSASSARASRLERSAISAHYIAGTAVKRAAMHFWKGSGADAHTQIS